VVLEELSTRRLSSEGRRRRVSALFTQCAEEEEEEEEVEEEEDSPTARSTRPAMTVSTRVRDEDVVGAAMRLRRRC
jgi:hypothetical protein